jgi:hypothetical protein
MVVVYHASRAIVGMDHATRKTVTADHRGQWHGTGGPCMVTPLLEQKMYVVSMAHVTWKTVGGDHRGAVHGANRPFKTINCDQEPWRTVHGASGPCNVISLWEWTMQPVHPDHVIGMVVGRNHRGHCMVIAGQTVGGNHRGQLMVLA